MSPHQNAPLRRQRRSAQRDSLRAIMDRDRRLISAQDIYMNLRSAGAEISLATVYRHLQNLSEAGEIHAAYGRDGEALYRRCSDSPHHHLRCSHCGRTEEIAAESERDSLSQSASVLGYGDVEFTIELVGMCSGCREGDGAVQAV